MWSLSQPAGREADRRKVPAVLLGGRETAMAVARSLGLAGVPVHAVGAPSDPIRHSRYCSSFSAPRTGANDQERWLSWLREGPGQGVLLPCADEALEIVANHRAELEQLGYIPFEADDDVVVAMLDKARTYTLAQRAGVPTPQWVSVRGALDVAHAVETLPFPCAVKPLLSHRFRQLAGRRAPKLLVARDRVELERLLRWSLDRGVEMMVTEIIPGSDNQLVGYVGYLDEQGQPLLQYTDHKLRQHPVHFGVGCYVESDWNPEVVDAGLRFCRGVGLRGVAHVEFKRDPRDGELKLIECNHRFHLAIELARVSGLDFPLSAYNRLLNRDPPPAGSYRPGAKQWRVKSDLQASWKYHRAGELSVREWAVSLLHRQHFTVFSWRDPLPAAFGVAHFLRKAAHEARQGAPHFDQAANGRLR